MSESVASELTDVLPALNPDLTRHQAYARASRILRYSTRGAPSAGIDAGRLFSSALYGTKRVLPTGTETRLRTLVRSLVHGYPWGVDEPINGGDLVEFMAGEWIPEARALLRERPLP